MILNEFQISDDQDNPNVRVPFHSQIRCVMALFEECLPRIETENTHKVFIKLSQTEEEKIISSSGVLQVTKNGDIGNFYTLSDMKKKEFALGTLMNLLPPVVDYLGLSLEPFILAAQEVIKQNYKLHWEQSSKWHPSRKYRGFLLCEHEPEHFKGFLRIEDKNKNLISQKEVIKTYPSEDCYWRFIQKVQWVDKTKLCAFNKNGNVIDHLNLIVPS